jgi:hypothetical protein
MAMGTSRRLRRATLAIALLAALGAAIAAGAMGRGGKGVRLPAAWSQATISSGAATLSYPSNWKAIPGDDGTVSFALRDRRGLYLGYLNVTPRQGEEQLAGWPAFRVHRNAEEGDTRVRVLGSAENVRFSGARGSCVTDEYRSRIGSHTYREMACIVAGRHSTSVFIGAALVADWAELAPILQHSAATLIER